MSVNMRNVTTEVLHHRKKHVVEGGKPGMGMDVLLFMAPVGRYTHMHVLAKPHRHTRVRWTHPVPLHLDMLESVCVEVKARGFMNAFQQKQFCLLG